MKIRRILCMLLALMMVFSIAFPVTIFADDMFDEIVLEDENYTVYEEPIDDVIEEEPIDDAIVPDEEPIIDETVSDEEPYVEEISEDEIAEPISDEAVIEDTIVEEVQPEPEVSVVAVDDEAKADETEPEAVEAQPETVAELTLAEAADFNAVTFKITKQPEDVSAAIGETAEISVEAQGKDLHYTWYFKNKGKTRFSKSTITTATYSVTMQAALDGREMYVVVTNGDGKTIESDHVFFSVGTDGVFKITKQPEDVSAVIGETAEISVEAQGKDLTYTWYFKNKGKSKFSKSSVTTATYSVAMQAVLDGREMYVVVTNGDGKTIESDHVFFSISSIVSGDFVFKKIDGTNNLMLTEYKGNDASITVPGTVDNMTVTEIGKSVFEGNTTLTSVALPNSITAIREKAFKGCTNLSSMTTY